MGQWDGDRVKWEGDMGQYEGDRGQYEGDMGKWANMKLTWDTGNGTEGKIKVTGAM